MTPHRYGCRCPSCNEGTTRAPTPPDRKIPIGPQAPSTIVGTPADARIHPARPARPKKHRGTPTK